MNLHDFCAASGLSDKTARNWVRDGLLRPSVVRTRYGKAFEFTADDVDTAKQIAADVRAGKVRRNRDHRSAEIASAWDRERAAGGKTAAQATKMLAQGEKPAVVLARICANGRDISRMDWALLIDVYRLSFGTSNPVELAERHAPLPQTIDRLRRRMLAMVRNGLLEPRNGRAAVRVRR